MEADYVHSTLRAQTEIISAFGGRCGVAFLGKGWAITCETRLAATTQEQPNVDINLAKVLSGNTGSKTIQVLLPARKRATTD